MRRIVNSTYITLDGVIEDPQDWPTLGSSDDAGGQIQVDLLLSCDILLMGRRTYDVFAASWPTRSGDPYSDHINAMDKYVVSSTVTDPDWEGTQVIDGDPVEAVRRLKEGDGGDIVQYGFGELSYALLEAGLIDELRLWVHPFLLRPADASTSILRPGDPASFSLVDATPLSSGIVVLTYTPA
ncbi:MAG TPA: dihydrofolate reductase family protein [Iamia sp.]|nr:dihydrofolate reductase family protein [Iamia sp.]